MNTLDQWEADAKWACKQYSSDENEYTKHERILTLIELVRKKDEYLLKLKNSHWECLDHLYLKHHNVQDEDDILFQEALVLTQELK